jgi:ferredoxin
MPETMTLLAGGRPLPAVPGDTILSAMKAADKAIFNICGGRGMCGTCRVAVDEEWLGLLPPPAFSETRLLRVLKAAKENHRLACQTILDARHDGLRFTPDPPPTRVLLQEERKDECSIGRQTGGA